MNIEINPALDFGSLKSAFIKSKRLRVDNFLTPESANYIAEGLKNFKEWHLVHSDESGLPVRYDAHDYSKLDKQQLLAIDEKLNRRATEHYQYKYKFYPIIDAIKHGVLQNTCFFYNVANFVNSTDFIRFSRALTGVNTLVKMDPQGTLYEPGDFLTMHDDSNYQQPASDQSTRRFAIVLGFTKGWSANWGGQTAFYSQPNAVESVSWKPGFNVLTIFEVPTQHSVSYVAPFAASGRYSITGWLRDDPSVIRPDLEI